MHLREMNSSRRLKVIKCNRLMCLILGFLLGSAFFGFLYLVGILNEEVVIINNDVIVRPPERRQKVRGDFFAYVKSEMRNAVYPGVENYTNYIIEKKKIQPLENVKPLIPEFGPILNDVTSFEYPLSVESCPASTSGRSLFIAIISAPGYFKKRQTIRQTWVQHLHYQSDLLDVVGYAFIVGLTKNETVQKILAKESSVQKDIIQVGMMDDYYNITLKVSGLLNWLQKNCASVNFVLKVDDDVYVNARNLAAMIQTLPTSEERIYGVQMPLVNLEPERYRGDKWSISYEDWPWMYYPNFLRGASVLMSGTSIESLLAGFQTVPFIPFDDVYLSGLAASKAGVDILTNYWMFQVTPWFPFDACLAYGTMSWLTYTTDEMRSAHVATEQFYSGLKKCVITPKNAKMTKYADPKEALDFPFRQVLQQ